MDKIELEKYSSAITLSDMEVFVFPELMYSLVLANIMSPIIWRWREEPCFKKLEGKSTYRKLLRLRQYVMDEFEFNLDLETWGLTTKERELERFKEIVSAEQIAKSNALFGYHGDKYYFDVDIRRHFGLDKYNSNVIPYWKTETIEAMQAFRRKEGYRVGAGECVSLAALYAAAAFVVCGIPLEDIYMILTPLHSQNFLDVRDGILTNNRRLVTKTMWFNGTEISNKAQRALRNERVTIVAHNTGYIHCLYNEATINRAVYKRFVERLGQYLSAELTMEVFAGFLRSHREYQKYFQMCRDCHGQAQYVKAEVLFHYEHGSNYKIGCRSHDKLLEEVCDEDFSPYPLADRIRCEELNAFLEQRRPDMRTESGRAEMEEFLGRVIPEAKRMVEDLANFVYIEAKLPSMDKRFVESKPIEISVEQTREEIIDYLESVRSENVTADLAFYAWRDMERCDWRPFIKAAVERNPVSLEMVRQKDLEQVYTWLRQLDDVSIYEGKRLAQPDEVVNYRTGDGLEKALLLANVIRERHKEQEVEVVAAGQEVIVQADKHYRFESNKGLQGRVRIARDGSISV